MKWDMATKPIRRRLEALRDVVRAEDPTVRSSMISIGAASEPARSSSATSFVSCGGHAAGDLEPLAVDSLRMLAP